MNNIESHLKRLANYERVLLDTIKFSKQELLGISILNQFLRLCLNMDFSKISWDEFLRKEIHIDARRFYSLIAGRVLLDKDEIANIYSFIRLHNIAND